MERGVFGILVLSGLCHFASSFHHRQYHFVKEAKNWFAARKYCIEKHTDLATVNSERDLEELAGLISSEAPVIYLGLRRIWGWSLSDTDDYREGEQNYRNWAKDNNRRQQDCASMRESGEWMPTNCKIFLDFFCYNASNTNISERFTLYEFSVDWFTAQHYCRMKHTDLARVRNHLDNQELLRKGNKGRAWIGLTRTTWEWTDGREPSFTPWVSHNVPSVKVGDCGVLQVDNLGLVDWDCDNEAPFFCYSDNRRKHLLRLKLTADDPSVAVTDPVLTDSILKWVEGKLSVKGASKDVKLSWRKLPTKALKTQKEPTAAEVCVP